MKTLSKVELVAGGMVLAAVAGATVANLVGKRPKKSTYWWKYNPRTEQEIEGKVMDIIYSGFTNGGSKGMDLIVESDDQIIPVKLGPAWFMENQNITFKKAEKIIVKGSRIHQRGKQVLVASSVKYGGRVLKLRDENGHPFWEAWNKGI